jgi:hypothetical protein
MFAPADDTALTRLVIAAARRRASFPIRAGEAAMAAFAN